MKSYRFRKDKYKKIECVVRNSEKEKEAIFEIKGAGRSIHFQILKPDEFALIRTELQDVDEYNLITDNIEFGEIYLSDSEDMLDEGVRYLFPDDSLGALVPVELLEWYDVPQREQYHFSPFINWMNDPNGMCFFRGRYHIFYQKNPFDQEWGNCFWGHASSTDMIHWKHLPIAFEPQEELRKNSKLIGGAFSGSACVVNNKMYAVFTRVEEQKDNWKNSKQYQVMAQSDDGVEFGEEEVIIPAFTVPGAGKDFRDPKIVEINGVWYIVLGSQLYGKAAILLFRSFDMKKWEYLHPLIVEEDPRIEAFECPDFFCIGDQFIVTGAWMSYRDEQGRFNPMRYYIGDFKEEEFLIKNAGFCDFGEGYYATQSFSGLSRKVTMSWISDWEKKQKPYLKGAKGSLSLPRELEMKGYKLYQKPVREIYSLIKTNIIEEKNTNIKLDEIEGNSYYVLVQFSHETNFRITFAKTETTEYSIINCNGIAEIIGGDTNTRYAFPECEINSLEIFVDRTCVEIFLNGGEFSATKLILCEKKVGYLETEICESDLTWCVKVSTLESGWKEK